MGLICKINNKNAGKLGKDACPPPDPKTGVNGYFLALFSFYLECVQKIHPLHAAFL
jgi:hypothetical protein